MVEQRLPARDAILDSGFAEISTDGQYFGRYRLVSRIGTGPVGVVVAAECTKLGRKVALKIYGQGGSEDNLAVERHFQGARSAASLASGPAAEIFELGEVDGRRFLARELLPGSSLADVQTTQMSQTATVQCFARVVDAVAAIHKQGRAHGNLKPENIFYRGDGTAVLVDSVSGGGEQDDIRSLREIFGKMLCACGANATQPAHPDLVSIWRCCMVEHEETYQRVQRLAAGLRHWLETHAGARSATRGAEADRKVRAVAMFAGGVILLMATGLLFALWLVGAILYYSPSQYGVLLQSFLELAGMPGVLGAYLILAAARTCQGGSGTVTARLIDEVPFDARRPPDGSPLRIHRSEGQWSARRPLGSWAGTTVVLLSLGYCLVGCMAIAWQSPAWALTPELLVALSLLVAAACVCIAILRWLWIRPLDVRFPYGDRLGGWFFSRVAAWCGRESLGIDAQDCRHEISLPWATRARRVPLAEIWDVGYGSDESGIEIAAQGQSLRVGKRLQARDRQWLGKVIQLEIDRRRETTANKSRGPDATAVPRTSPGGVVWCLFSCAWGLLPLAVLTEATAGISSPQVLPPASPLRCVELSITLVSLLLVLVSMCLMMAGSVRLLALRKSGARLFRAGVWLGLSSFLVVKIAANAMALTDSFSTPQITTAINIGCLAFSIRILASIAAVLSLSFIQPRLPLNDN